MRRENSGLEEVWERGLFWRKWCLKLQYAGNAELTLLPSVQAEGIAWTKKGRRYKKVQCFWYKGWQPLSNKLFETKFIMVGLHWLVNSFSKYLLRGYFMPRLAVTHRMYSSSFMSKKNSHFKRLIATLQWAWKTSPIIHSGPRALL